METNRLSAPYAALARVQGESVAYLLRPFRGLGCLRRVTARIASLVLVFHLPSSTSLRHLA